MTDYDFIGDIHGYSDKLEELLIKLGYRRKGKGYKHVNRKAFFIGDYIDRGPNNPKVIEIVRSMVDNDSAIAICGNHEHNAICFNHFSEKGYLRKHLIKNIKQHSETLLQFHGRQDLYDEAIEWFKTLPLYIEHENFNAVHASYDANAIQFLNEQLTDGVLSEEDYNTLYNEDSELFKAVEITCKGKEIKLPYEQYFIDKDGTKRQHVRVKWWLDPRKHSLKELSFIDTIEKSDIIVNSDVHKYYGEDEKPVFFGHYWLPGKPKLIRSNICCLDYSIAKGGYLMAYRFSGEPQLKEENVVYV